MDRLRRALGRHRAEGGTPSPGRPAWMSHGMSVTLLGGSVPLEVKGESYYQDALRKIVDADGRDVVAVLAPEPENRYDPNAVAIWVSGLKVGHLSREDASRYQAVIQHLMNREGQPIALEGRIVGGEPEKPSLGIWLRYDPTDFREGD